MRFDRPLVQLPIKFCAESLVAEVSALPPEAWTSHPDGFPGNNAVRLITPGGTPTDDLRGEMAATEYLLACPFIMEIMAELGGTWGRSRLMGLAPGAQVPPHIDSHYYWRTHLRIHIPIITNPGVAFTCGGETVHMRPGECWTFDSFQRHEVHNRGGQHRVHLVLDTIGGRELWDTMEQAQTETATPRDFFPGDGRGSVIQFERVNAPKVMSPWEIKCHVALLQEQALPHPLLDPVLKQLDRFIQEWSALWAQYGTADAGVPRYSEALMTAARELHAFGAPTIMLRNGLSFYFVLQRLVFEVAYLVPQTATASVPSSTQGPAASPR